MFSNLPLTSSSEVSQDVGVSEKLAGTRRRHSSYSQETVKKELARQTHSLNVITDSAGRSPHTLLSPSEPSAHQQLASSEIKSSPEGVNDPNPLVAKELNSPSIINDDGRTGSQARNSDQSVDIMHEFGCRLFDTAPYNLVQRLYNSSTREAIILILATFFLYNGFRCVLQTMCEDGGFRKVFTSSESAMGESLRRVAILLLRIMTVVISPLCFCVHISRIASKPHIPRTTFSEEVAIQRMMRVHRSFSPHYEVRFIQAEPQKVFEMSETMTKRHINSIWLSLVCSLLFAALLSYIGGTKLSSRGFTEGGACQLMTASIIHLPLMETDIHPLMILDLLLMLSVLIANYMLKDFYYYENRIATFAVTVGGEGEKLYHEIRQRWSILDWYSYAVPIAISVGIFALSSVKKTIIPDLTTRLQPEDLLNWFFWISVLTVVSCLGLSPNRLVKKTSLPAYLLIAFLLRVVNLNIDAIPPESLVIYFLIGASVMAMSLLWSVSSCHYHHWQHTQNRESLALFLFSLSLMALLPTTVMGALYRETVHLAAFVEW